MEDKLQELRDKIDEIQADLENCSKKNQGFPFSEVIVACGAVALAPLVTGSVAVASAGAAIASGAVGSVAASVFPEEIFNHMKVKEERNRFWQSIEKYRLEKKFDTYTELYEKAHVSHETFGKIRAMDIKREEKNPDYKPEKETVFQLCLTLKLTLEQATELLKMLGYYFTDMDLIDRLVSWCLKEKKNYSVETINEELYRRTKVYPFYVPA